jgi:hypothetical protein
MDQNIYSEREGMKILISACNYLIVFDADAYDASHKLTMAARLKTTGMDAGESLSFVQANCHKWNMVRRGIEEKAKSEKDAADAIAAIGRKAAARD